MVLVEDVVRHTSTVPKARAVSDNTRSAVIDRLSRQYKGGPYEGLLYLPKAGRTYMRVQFNDAQHRTKISAEVQQQKAWSVLKVDCRSDSFKT
jgi:hypothetical protein